MAKVIAAAVRARQRDRGPGLEVRYERDVLRLDRRACARIRDRARRSPAAAQPGQAGRAPPAHRRPVQPGGRPDRLRRAGRREPAQRGGHRRNPPGAAGEPAGACRAGGVLARLTPERPADGAARLAGAAGSRRPWLLTPEERSALLRPPGGGWTPADVPLLDEAAELLGEDDQRGPRAADERERRRRIALRARGARPGLRLPVGRPEPGGGGGDPVRLRHHRRRTPGGPLRGRRRPHRGGTGAPPTGPGRSGTSWWTRRRSSRRWRGGCSCGAARPGR